MTDKRPETDADILSRSRRLSGTQVRLAQEHAMRLARGRRYRADLPVHMAECDANYARLLQLFPDLRENDAQTIALPLQTLQAQVCFEVIEKGPFTTLLRIDVQGSERDADASSWAELMGSPTLTVRVYHDARSAEVVSYQEENRFHSSYDYPNTRMRQRDEKVQLNRFLGEFLALCLAHGASHQSVAF